MAEAGGDQVAQAGDAGGCVRLAARCGQNGPHLRCRLRDERALVVHAPAQAFGHAHGHGIDVLHNAQKSYAAHVRGVHDVDLGAGEKGAEPPGGLMMPRSDHRRAAQAPVQFLGQHRATQDRVRMARQMAGQYVHGGAARLAVDALDRRDDHAIFLKIFFTFLHGRIQRKGRNAKKYRVRGSQDCRERLAPGHFVGVGVPQRDSHAGTPEEARERVAEPAGADDGDLLSGHGLIVNHPVGKLRYN